MLPFPFIFAHQVETFKRLKPLISVTQLFKNRLKDTTNFYNTILLPIVAQVYEFHKKSEKLN